MARKTLNIGEMKAKASEINSNIPGHVWIEHTAHCELVDENGNSAGFIHRKKKMKNGKTFFVWICQNEPYPNKELAKRKAESIKAQLTLF